MYIDIHMYNDAVLKFCKAKLKMFMHINISDDAIRLC